MYNYFVSYNWSNKEGQQGSGCRIISRKGKITSKTNISDLCDELIEEINSNKASPVKINNAVILNFILLDK